MLMLWKKSELVQLETRLRLVREPIELATISTRLSYAYSDSASSDRYFDMDARDGYIEVSCALTILRQTRKDDRE
jgi:hypothetical protein